MPLAHSLRSNALVRCLAVAVLAAVASLAAAQPAAAGTVTGTDDPFFEPNIPDYNGDPSIWTGNLHREIVISGAPGGARVTNVTLRLDLHHTYVGDLIIWYGTANASHQVWNRVSSGDTDGIHRSIPSPTQFDGISPNTTWHLYIKDMADVDTGELESWSITIDYADCVVDSDCGTWQKCQGGTCVDKNCADLGYPLGSCTSTSSDGDCMDGYTEVWECVDAGPINCWSLRDGCSANEVCYDALGSAALCVAEGTSDYCKAQAAAGGGCAHGEADCDFDSECSGSLVCQGPILGGGVDGCCWSDEDWDGSRCIAQDCASLGYPLGSCGTATSDGECMAGGDEVWQCVDAGPVNCWTRRETCTGSDVCFDGLVAAATCVSVGSAGYCAGLVAAGSACQHGQSDCDFDSECAGSLECQGSILGGGVDGCCTADEEWNGSTCLPKDCASLGYPLGACGTATSDGECMADGDEVWQCVDAGPVNCWSRRETCAGTDVCFDALTAAATCIGDGENEYCRALVDAGSVCGHGQSDCDFDSECAGGLECVGSILGGTLDGCCTADEDWSGSACIPKDCVSLGYPLGACGTATGDGECMLGGAEVWQCVDAGPANCWQVREECLGTAVCFDALSAAATCIDDGENEYCRALVDAGSVCQHGQSDCDFDSECAGALECAGSVLGGTLDGCCTADEDWNGSACVPRDCGALGYPLGPCGVTSGDGECSDDGGAVWQCVDAGPVNCWQVRETCAGSDVCFDGLIAAATCISEGDGAYCEALADAGRACAHGQADCDFDSECAAGLHCAGSILGDGVDGCCSPDEDWDGDSCIPTDCAALGYPLGGCAFAASDGECADDFGAVHQCVDAGPANCWQVRETCAGDAVCDDPLAGAARCVPEGDPDYCTALVGAGRACAHGQADCDFDSECAGDLQCAGPILGAGVDGCCNADEDWDGAQCIPRDCVALGYPLGACTFAASDGECAPDFGSVRQCVDAGPVNCWQVRETCAGTAVCDDPLASAARCLDDGHEDYCTALAGAGRSCAYGQSDCDFDSQCAGDLVCVGPVFPFTGLDGCCRDGETWDGERCVGENPCDVCQPDETGCDDGTHRWACALDATGGCLVREVVACGPDEACAAGVCGPATTTCATSTDCPAEQHCAEGRCEPDLCAQGRTGCRGPAVVTCAADGATFAIEEACGVGEGCLGSACACLTDEGCPSDAFCPYDQVPPYFSDFDRDPGADPEWDVVDRRWTTDAGALVCVLAPGNVAAVADGAVTAVGITVPGSPPEPAGGQLDSARADFQYGSYRARIRTSREAHTNNAFFFLDGDTGQEIDVEIYPGAGPGDAAVDFVVHPRPNDQEGLEQVPLAFDPAAGYHVYGFDRYPDHVAFLIDETVVARIGRAWGHPNIVVPDTAGTIILSHWTAAPPHYLGGPPAQTARMRVDWVSFTPFGGACLADVCPQGQTYCEGNAVWRCRADGGDTERVETCPQACADGACVAACATNADCEAAEHCAEGHCAADVCPQGQSYCEGSDLRRCDPAGASSVRVQTCEYGCADGACLAASVCATDADCPSEFWCDGQTGACRPDVCPQGQDFCDGAGRFRCDAVGSDSALVETCPQGCADGVCLGGGPDCVSDMDCDQNRWCDALGVCQPDVCPQGQEFCDGRDARVCAANGATSTFVVTCPDTCAAGRCVGGGGCVSNDDCRPDEFCDAGNGACAPDVCPQGGLYCAPAELRRCDAAGAGWTTVAPCAFGCEDARCLECRGSGDCAAAEYCTDAGACAPDVCQQGARTCDGADVVLCAADGGSAQREQVCPNGCADGACLAACTDDAQCAADEACEGGACAVTAACQGVTWQGCCDGATVHWCDHGELGQLDCAQEGIGCGWLAEGDWFWCTGEASLPPAGTSGLCPWSTCTPSCTGRDCGSDGCGGSCGACDAGEACQSGTCAPCTADCADRACGDDGCGGTCGDCAPGQRCAAEGLCEACTAACDGAECGDDGCGGTCGACPATDTCAEGLCVCVPNCRGRQCGDDGCGGQCGTCPGGTTCGPAGRCGAGAPDAGGGGDDDTGGGTADAVGDKDAGGGSDGFTPWGPDLVAPDGGAGPDGGGVDGGGDSSGCASGGAAAAARTTTTPTATAWPLLALLAALAALALPRRRPRLRAPRG